MPAIIAKNITLIKQQLLSQVFYDEKKLKLLSHIKFCATCFCLQKQKYPCGKFLRDPASARQSTALKLGLIPLLSQIFFW